MKKILLILSMSLIFTGCISECNDCNYEPNYQYPTVKDEVLIFGTDFNEEHYIWESFIFPTNRTDGLK